MDLNDIRIVKANLEEHLKSVLTQEFKTFSRKTGIPVTGINVNMVQMQFLEDALPRTEVTNVRLSVEAGL